MTNYYPATQAAKDGIEINCVNYSGHVFDDFFVRPDPQQSPGYFVFGRNKEKYGTGKDGKGSYVMLCARPDVKPRKHPHYNNSVRRGWKTKREAQSVADKMNDFRDGKVTLNEAQGLYVIAHVSGAHRGYSCHGFDVVEGLISKYEAWLKQAGIWSPSIEYCELAKAERATVERYEYYKALVSVIRTSGKRCDVELTPQLVGLEGKRVEVVTDYDETRRFIVGKSTGVIPIHLEIANRQSSGGGGAEKHYKSVRVV